MNVEKTKIRKFSGAVLHLIFPRHVMCFWRSGNEKAATNVYISVILRYFSAFLIYFLIVAL